MQLLVAFVCKNLFDFLAAEVLCLRLKYCLSLHRAEYAILGRLIGRSFVTYFCIWMSLYQKINILLREKFLSGGTSVINSRKLSREKTFVD